MSEALAGGCFCGAIRFRLTRPVRQACHCHCESCRRASGAPFVTWCTVERTEFVVAKGRIHEHASSPRVTRGFCGDCGTTLTYIHDARPTEIDVTVAALDAPERIVPTRHIFTSDKLPWIAIDDGLPQYATVSSEGSPLES
jgi:hypothetical protein